MNFPLPTMAAGALIFAVGTYYAIFPSQPQVYKNFNLPAEYLSKLGKPQAAVVISDNGNAEFVHERATIIWKRRDQEFLFLKRSPQTWEAVTELNSPEDKRYWKNDFLKSKPVFSAVPDGRFPPYAGVARIWEEYPDKWMKELGWRIWQCSLPVLYFQHYENGVVVGPGIDSPASLGHGVIYVLFNDKTWKSWTVPESQKLFPVTDHDGIAVE